MYLDLSAIGQFIQSFRKEAKMTQAELGERLNVSAQSVSNWERGESLPDIALLPDLARILHCSVDAILYAGNGCGSYRRHMTVADAREALLFIRRIGDLLGDDHPVYETIIQSINTSMNPIFVRHSPIRRYLKYLSQNFCCIASKAVIMSILVMYARISKLRNRERIC